MTQLPPGKTRLDLVREGLTTGSPLLKRQGRLIVGLDQIVEDPRNERRTFRNMEGLVASIRAVGLVEPITVTPFRSRRTSRTCMGSGREAIV